MCEGKGQGGRGMREAGCRVVAKGNRCLPCCWPCLPLLLALLALPALFSPS